MLLWIKINLLYVSIGFIALFSVLIVIYSIYIKENTSVLYIKTSHDNSLYITTPNHTSQLIGNGSGSGKIRVFSGKYQITSVSDTNCETYKTINVGKKENKNLTIHTADTLKTVVGEDILKQLPYTDTSGPFTVDIDYSKNSDNNCTSNLVITDSSPQGRMNALHWLRQNGVDPTNIAVEFDDFTNPLQKGD